ncbi:MAG TPA: hypothetical protein VK179_15390 [Bacteroidales bacterium]|nr:hypothetical protein [Bacteroidales bacterium]
MEDEDLPIDPTTLPIFIKAEEIRDMVQRICDLLPEDNKQLQFLKEELLGHSLTITSKLAGTAGDTLYSIKMEAATFIRRSAHDLVISYHSLKQYGFKEVEYYLTVRELIEEFRLLFIDWVAGFDKWNYIIDRWGLFNPPGVGPFDKDPDDDIPWDGERFEDED